MLKHPLIYALFPKGGEHAKKKKHEFKRFICLPVKIDGRDTPRSTQGNLPPLNELHKGTLLSTQTIARAQCETCHDDICPLGLQFVFI